MRPHALTISGNRCGSMAAVRWWRPRRRCNRPGALGTLWPVANPQVLRGARLAT